MSFLHQLKTQARAMQALRTAQEQLQEERIEATEKACRLIAYYFEELARQLTVIQPPGPEFSVDGKTPWPAMKLVDFTSDARRKRIGDLEVFDYVALGWRVVPKSGEIGTGSVTVNFPTDMRRVEDRLAMGPVDHERQDVRATDRNVLQAVRYVYRTTTRGSVIATPEHDPAKIKFRLLNTYGFEVMHKAVPVSDIGHSLLDELAKRVMGQRSVFI
jgi:hypothetical protein